MRGLMWMMGWMAMALGAATVVKADPFAADVARADKIKIAQTAELKGDLARIHQQFNDAAGYYKQAIKATPGEAKLYNKTAEAPGQAGSSKSPSDFTWHVKGNLFLTGEEWSGRPISGRMPLESYEYHFDFNEGRPDKDPSGWPYPSSGMRALCVRGPDERK